MSDENRRLEASQIIDGPGKLDPRLEQMGFIEVEAVDGIIEPEKELSQEQSTLRSAHRPSQLLKNNILFQPVLRGQLHS